MCSLTHQCWISNNSKSLTLNFLFLKKFECICIDNYNVPVIPWFFLNTGGYSSNFLVFFLFFCFSSCCVSVYVFLNTEKNTKKLRDNIG